MADASFVREAASLSMRFCSCFPAAQVLGYEASQAIGRQGVHEDPGLPGNDCAFLLDAQYLSCCTTWQLMMQARNNVQADGLLLQARLLTL